MVYGDMTKNYSQSAWIIGNNGGFHEDEMSGEGITSSIEPHGVKMEMRARNLGIKTGFYTANWESENIFEDVSKQGIIVLYYILKNGAEHVLVYDPGGKFKKAINMDFTNLCWIPFAYLELFVVSDLVVEEDSGRILLGMRLAACLSFSCTNETNCAVHKLPLTILSLAKSTILMELDCMISFGNAVSSLVLLQRYRLQEIRLSVEAAHLVEKEHSRSGQSPLMLMKLFSDLDKLISCNRPLHNCFWVAIFSVHLVLIKNFQWALVVLTFASSDLEDNDLSFHEGKFEQLEKPKENMELTETLRLSLNFIDMIAKRSDVEVLSSQAAEKIDDDSKKPQAAAADCPPDKSDVFEAPSFMTLVESGDGVDKDAAVSDSLLLQNNRRRRILKSLERDVGCRFEVISPPSIEEVFGSTVEQMVVALSRVQPEIVLCFITTAHKTMDVQGVYTLTAALVQLNGISQLSLSHSLPNHEQRVVIWHLIRDSPRSHGFLSNRSITRSKHMWMLNLSNSSFKELSSSIGQLKYLDPSGNSSITTFADFICSLQILQTLRVSSGGNFMDLSKDVEYMINLRLVKLSYRVIGLNSYFLVMVKALVSGTFDEVWDEAQEVVSGKVVHTYHVLLVQDIAAPELLKSIHAKIGNQIKLTLHHKLKSILIVMVFDPGGVSECSKLGRNFAMFGLRGARYQKYYVVTRMDLGAKAMVHGSVGVEQQHAGYEDFPLNLEDKIHLKGKAMSQTVQQVAATLQQQPFYESVRIQSGDHRQEIKANTKYCRESEEPIRMKLIWKAKIN